MYSYYVYYCILVVFCILGLKVLHGLINQSINQSISLSLSLKPAGYRRRAHWQRRLYLVPSTYNSLMRNTHGKWGPEKISHFLINVSKPIEILRKFQVLSRIFFSEFEFLFSKKINTKKFETKKTEKNSE